MADKQPLFAFFGTPRFAVQVLCALESHGLLPALVITAPEKPAGAYLFAVAVLCGGVMIPCMMNWRRIVESTAITSWRSVPCGLGAANACFEVGGFSAI